MDNNNQRIGFIYFSEPTYFINRKIQTWLPALHDLGANTVIFGSDFSKAIPEDVFNCARVNDLTPVVHFKAELPLARKLNDVAFLLDVYSRWGVSDVILGDKPNLKLAWPTSGWHYENLVDHFLDRFIPLANHAVRIGLTPVMAPLQAGGDYWDTAFIELLLKGLMRRRLDAILDQLCLSCYGYTFNKPLSWGQGGPERWPGSKPYLTPNGQEDQLGFNNFEWLNRIGQKVTRKDYPVIILDAGNSGMQYSRQDGDSSVHDIRAIYKELNGNEESRDLFAKDSIKYCAFSLETILDRTIGVLSIENLNSVFKDENNVATGKNNYDENKKLISHYLLLPSHTSGVADVVLNKVRPIIKKFQPTVGFSLEEAVLAKKVSVYPDEILFSDADLNQLRSSGCIVELLPESGIEIATRIQETSINR